MPGFEEANGATALQLGKSKGKALQCLHPYLWPGSHLVFRGMQPARTVT